MFLSVRCVEKLTNGIWTGEPNKSSRYTCRCYLVIDGEPHAHLIDSFDDDTRDTGGG